MSSTVTQAERPRSDDANVLQREIEDAHASLQSCFHDMEQILGRPEFDAGALTSVRLKLAGLRLTRGPLITRVGDALSGHVTREEGRMLEELRSSHQQLLQTATAHTRRWTLEAIAADWSQYRNETRELMKQWKGKAEREQQLVYPLIRKWAELSQDS